MCISKNQKLEAISANTSCNSYDSSCCPSCASLSTRDLTHIQSDSNNTLWTVSKRSPQWQLISFIVALRRMKPQPFAFFYKRFFLQDASAAGTTLLVWRHFYTGHTDFLCPVTARPADRQTTCANPSSPWKPKHNTPLTDTWLMDRGQWVREEGGRELFSSKTYMTNRFPLKLFIHIIIFWSYALKNKGAN